MIWYIQIVSEIFRFCHQGTIQKKSASGSRTLPYLVIFLRNFILNWKCQKGSLNRGTLVSATAIYQTNCPFTALSALFLFFRTLPYDSKLFPGYSQINFSSEHFLYLRFSALSNQRPDQKKLVTNPNHARAQIYS